MNKKMLVGIIITALVGSLVAVGSWTTAKVAQVPEVYATKMRVQKLESDVDRGFNRVVDKIDEKFDCLDEKIDRIQERLAE